MVTSDQIYNAIGVLTAIERAVVKEFPQSDTAWLKHRIDNVVRLLCAGEAPVKG